jgi:hypothetical protein
MSRYLLLLLAGSALCRAACEHPGKERWAIKSTVPAGVDLKKTRTVKITDVAGLINPPGVTNKDSRFAEDLIPSFTNPLHLKEGDLVTFTGYLFLIATEDNDCEYHIQIASKFPDMSKPMDLDDCVIVEVAMPEDLADPALSAAAEDVRKWVHDKLKLKTRNDNQPTSTGVPMSHPVHVKVSGQLFFDDAHLKNDGTSQPRGKLGFHTNTLWELHPVYHIEFTR